MNSDWQAAYRQDMRHPVRVIEGPAYRPRQIKVTVEDRIRLVMGIRKQKETRCQS
jgi:hypothetical protein